LATIDVQMLGAERRRFFLATQGGVYFPITGAIFWLGLGVAGFYLSPRTWCVSVLSAGFIAIPIGIVLFKKVGCSFDAQVTAGKLDFAGLLPVVLSLGMALAAFNSDMTLVPLALVIGLASHWPAVGWFYETPIFAVHSFARVVSAVALWFFAARWPLYLVTDVYWTHLCGDGGVDLARSPTLALGRSVVIGQ
jgi:Family of unknown function (DUF7010)